MPEVLSTTAKKNPENKEYYEVPNRAFVFEMMHVSHGLAGAIIIMLLKKTKVVHSL
jgi:hypothetical protein